MSEYAGIEKPITVKVGSLFGTTPEEIAAEMAELRPSLHATRNAQPLTIDEPDSVCYFDRWFCHAIAGLGGFDRHHEHPKFLGGAESGTELILCPIHHRITHSVIRAMVEHDDPDVRLLRLIHRDVRQVARAGYDAWVELGKPDPSTIAWAVAAAKVKETA